MRRGRVVISTFLEEATGVVNDVSTYMDRFCTDERRSFEIKEVSVVLK